MITVSEEARQLLLEEYSNFLYYVKITLSNGTILNITNEDIWSGGFEVDDAVSSENELQIGSAIVNKFTLRLINIYNDFSEYDFTSALVEAEVGIQLSNSVEKLKKGKFIVNDAKYNGQIILLECYDYMCKFDIPYSDSQLQYPATLLEIVESACEDIGVELATDNFPRNDYMIYTRPIETSTTYREVISWCAQIGGCFARFNTDGELEIRWYNNSGWDNLVFDIDGGEFDSDTPYSTGDNVDGGTMNPHTIGSLVDGGFMRPWSKGLVYGSGGSTASQVHFIYSTYSHELSVDDTVITGIRASAKVVSDSAATGEVVYTYGEEGYVLEISNNDFVTSETVGEIIYWLGINLIGFTYRKAKFSHASNPVIEAGDVGVYVDMDGNYYNVLISRATFSSGGSQTLVSAGQTPLRNSVARFSAIAKQYTDLRERINTERTARENSSGLYETTGSETRSVVNTYYIHDKSSLQNSTVIMKVKDNSVEVSSDGGTTYNGMKVDQKLLSGIQIARAVPTEDYNTRLLYALYTAAPYFSDVGEATLDSNGTCTVNIENIFKETISTSGYQVFLQPYGNGTCYVSSRGANGFVVNGTANMPFGWEIKAKQLGYQQVRLEEQI